VATGLVAPEKRASAIAIMFSGLTAATLLGVPAWAWLGLHFGWRATFWAVTAIGVLATAVIALFVSTEAAGQGSRVALRDELRVLARPQVLLGLAATVLGFGGVFTVYTFVQPMLTQLSGFADGTVSAVLLVFGAGMILGNFAGGRLADRALVPTLLGSLALLAAVLAAMAWAMHLPAPAVLFVGLLGAAGFATVAPLQLRVLQQAHGAGQSLASSLNIAAFNLGNALGAWLGGVVIEKGPGLGALPWTAALLTLGGLALAALGVRLERTRGTHVGGALARAA
jgi:DHA1 family inner membrane transport protein